LPKLLEKNVGQVGNTQITSSQTRKHKNTLVANGVKLPL